MDEALVGRVSSKLVKSFCKVFRVRPWLGGICFWVLKC